MTISADQVKALRDRTGAGFMECKAALTEAKGDMEGATTLLRTRALAQAAKRAGRSTGQGVIGSYIHMGGKIGVLVEFNCESDFVARTEDFQALAKELAMQVAASSPQFARREDVPADVIDHEKGIYRAHLEGSGKPANVVDLGELQSYVRRAVVAARLAALDVALSDDARKRLMKPVEIESFQVSQEGGATQKKGFEQAYFGTFAFVLVLYMSLLIYGIAVMRGILKEKSNRIMEVLLGAVAPNELMTGKILGIGLVGLTQIGVYVLTAGALRLWLASQASGGDWAATFQIFTLGKLAFFLVYFLLGYFLFTSLFAAVGSVCNSEEEAQNLQSPLMMCLVIPMVCTIYFVGNLKGVR